MNTITQYITENNIPVLLIFGFISIIGLLAAKYLDKLKIPVIVTYMLIGLLFGPSVLNLLTDNLLSNLHFLTEAILGFVAFKIGLEMDLDSLRQKGGGLIFTIFFESFLAVIAVALLVYIGTGSWPIALLLGSLAPASAPAGTVAIIDQYKAKGDLTQALYAVVGFDDAIGVIIFGIALAFGKGIIMTGGDGTFVQTLFEPFRKIGFSLVLGAALAILFIQLAKLLNNKMAVTFGFILSGVGLSAFFDLSEILSCMVMGIAIGNNKHHQSLREIEEKEIGIMLPLFYIFFFTLAGANLHLQALQHLGLLSILYIIGRVAGLSTGSYLGAAIGGLHDNIRKYLGLGILSQAGVAIGLALVLKQNLTGLGPVINETTQLTLGDQIGQTVFTTIAVTTFIFELIGPVSAKWALEKAGEIGKQ